MASKTVIRPIDFESVNSKFGLLFYSSIYFFVWLDSVCFLFSFVWFCFVVVFFSFVVFLCFDTITCCKLARESDLMYNIHACSW